MRSSKRKPSPSDSDIPGKRARRASEPDPEPIMMEYDDDDLDMILVRIQEQEASEALARKLQDEWNGVAGSSDQPVILDDTKGDAAMAKRLADEWELKEEDIISVEEPGRQDFGEWDLGDQDAELHDLEGQVFDIRDLEGPGVTDSERGLSDPLSPLTSSVTLSSTQDQSKDREISQTRRSDPSKKNSIAYSITGENILPDDKLSQFRELFTATRNCSKCGEAVPSPRGYVMFSGNTLPPSLAMLLHAPCSSCHTNHCRGCFNPVACPISCKGSSKNSKCGIESCCAEGRAIALFETLGGFDRQYLGERATSESRALAAMAKRKPANANSVGPGGTGYGTDTYGNGYGCGGRHGRGRGNSAVAESRKTSRADELAAHWEEIIVRALNTLTALLPSPYADSAKVYDILPHVSIEPLLSLSKLPELLGTLLRNDSVTDWIARSETYHAMITLLRRMADSELSVQVLIGQRWEMYKSCGIESWMWGDGEITWEKDKAGGIERAPPLYDHFKKLTKQCETFCAGASQMMDAGRAGDGGEDVQETMVKATSLCGDIIAARDDMERAMAVLGNATPPNGVSSSNTHLESEHDPSSSSSGDMNQGKGKGRDPAMDMEKAYSRACERLAFKHVMLSEDKKGKGKGLNYANHNYAKYLNQTETATRNPRDRLHLVKELAVMATSLPPGVWVRVDEVRNDAIKIMIAGPDDTPYAGGLFEFDCFMPMEYPNKPPLMHLRTTGGGTVRFNPNLYNDGKVCLSLLGTWPGRPEEQWSSKSSLLQVLVSIQSMILIDAPYFNEPGHGQADVKASVSIAYNREISFQTVRWAIVDWLKDEHRDGIWGDVIASHFSIRQSQIRKRIAEWSATDNRMRACTLHSTRTAGMYGVGLAPPPYHYSPGQPAVPAEQSIDLIQEFDAGIRRIQEWGTGQEDH